MTCEKLGPWTVCIPKPEKRGPKPRRRIPRGARPRVVRMTSVAEEKRECDRIARAIVFQRDGGRCQCCQTTEFCQWAHIVSRRYWRVRWVEENSMVLCRGCHKRFTEDPAGWDIWVATWFGNIHARAERCGDPFRWGQDKLWQLKIEAKIGGWHYERSLLLGLQAIAKERGITL